MLGFGLMMRDGEIPRPVGISIPRPADWKERGLRDADDDDDDDLLLPDDLGTSRMLS